MLLSLLSLAAFASTSIAVKPIHSHNDYTRAVPLWTALNLSIMSVEADVWWQSSQLFVAHTSGEIDKTKTLNSLYLANILGIINGTISSPTPISVANPLQLLIDFKSDGPTTYQPVHDALQALRAGGHLTTYSNGKLTQGAVTVVGTGNTPLASVIAANRATSSSIRTSAICTAPSPVWGSSGARRSRPSRALTGAVCRAPRKCKKLVLNAHDFGIRTRFWDTPSSVSTWNTFWAAGSDWVNADDLLAVSNAWGVFDSTVGPALKALEAEG
ncbi:hypothetical protein B0H14DRAFT_2767643 [Mycena olivaceomarginata]|nr:hypothetical protein B0H14DRAFT_2767643 [Mycena olivaceomarginata]